MKNFIKIIICSSLIFTLVGCGAKKNDTIVSKEILLEDYETKESEEVSEIITDKQKEQDLEIVNKMLPLMDSVMLCMLENDYEFNTNNTSFVWNVMAYYVGNYLTNFNINEDSEKIIFSENYSSITLLKEDVFKYMKGYVLNTIPEFEKREDILLITENEDSYSFELGDRGLSKSEIISFSKNTDNSFDVEIKLVSTDDNSEICTAIFHIETINDEIKYFPMVITNVNIQKVQPSIQMGTILEINEDNVILEINKEKKTFFFNENSKEQIKTKNIGGNIDIMIYEDTIINILN